MDGWLKGKMKYFEMKLNFLVYICNEFVFIFIETMVLLVVQLRQIRQVKQKVGAFAFDNRDFDFGTTKAHIKE